MPSSPAPLLPPQPPIATPAHDWVRDGYGGHILPNKSALKWFVRKYHDRLIRTGVLFPGGGRRQSLLAPDFGAEVCKIVHEQSVASLGEATDG